MELQKKEFSGIEYLDEKRLQAIGTNLGRLSSEQIAEIAFLTVRQVTELRRLAERINGLIIPRTPKEGVTEKSLSEVFDWAIQVARERGAAGDVIFQGMNWEVEKPSPRAN